MTTNQVRTRLNNGRRHPALYTIGGIVVGASVTSLLFGVQNANKKNAASLRGSDQFLHAEPDEFSVLSLQNTSTPSLQTQQPCNTSNGTSVDPKDEIKNSTSIIYSVNEDAEAEEINETFILSPVPTIPTYFPTTTSNSPTPIQSYFPTIFDFFTDMPTGIEDDVQSENFIQTRSQESAGFRLKMYWEEGYFWQERTEERWWCMQCVDKMGNSTCKKNSSMQLRNCRSKSDLDAIFTYTSLGDGGYQFRIANTNNMCLQKMGDRRAIRVRPCKDDQMLQRFVGFHPDLDRFDLRPINYSDRCLTNHHHPKPNETVYAETCKKAHKYDTGYWVRY